MALTSKPLVPAAAILAMSFASGVAAAPIYITYSNDFMSEIVLNRVSARGGFLASAGGDGLSFTLPKFDPALGTLLSARVTLSGQLESVRFMHASRLLGGTAFIENSSLVVSTRVRIFSDDGTADPLDDVELVSEHAFKGCSDSRNFGTVSCEVEDGSNHIFGSTQDFTGSDLTSFIGDSNFVFTGADMRFLFSGIDGDPVNFSDSFDIVLSDLGVTTGGGAGTRGVGLKVGAAILVVGAYIASNANDGHGVLSRYADIHAGSVYGFGADITYTYEPIGSGAVSVPEPTALSLLGLGLLVMGAARRRRKA